MALFANPVRRRHAHAIEDHLRRRLALPAHLALVGAKAETRRALLDDEGRHALGAIVRGPRHQHVNVRRARARDELFRAGDDIVVAILHGLRLQARRIRSRARLGQAIARNQVHAGQPRHPGLALRLIAERIDHPARHVVDRDERRRRHVAIGKLLEDQRRVRPRQARSAHIFLHINARKAQLRRALDHIDREMALMVPPVRMRQQLVDSKLLRHVADHDLFVCKHGAHWHFVPYSLHWSAMTNCRPESQCAVYPMIIRSRAPHAMKYLP